MIHLDWNVGYANLTTGDSRALAQTLASEGMPTLCPNGRYIAYQSDESGRQGSGLRYNPL